MRDGHDPERDRCRLLCDGDRDVMAVRLEREAALLYLRSVMPALMPVVTRLSETEVIALAHEVARELQPDETSGRLGS